MRELAGSHSATKVGFGRKLGRWSTFVAVAAACLWAARASAAGLTLSNDQITATWKQEGKTLRPPTLQDLATGDQVELRGDIFTLVLTNGDFLRSSGFKLVGD